MAKKKTLWVTLDEFSEIFSIICDVVARDEFDVGEATPGLRHTSPYARNITSDIIDRLAQEGWIAR